MNLVLDIERAPGTGARQHVAGQLRAALLSGQVAAGEPLPSTRVLAASLAVSRGTVVAAYEDLAGEGYVEIRPGSGTFAARELPGAAKVVPQDPAPSTGPRQKAAQPGDTAEISLSPGSPAARFHEDREWVAAWRAALRTPAPPVPPGPAGEAPLRQLIAQHLAAHRGVRCSADEILITAGTSDALGLLVHGLAERTRGRIGATGGKEDPRLRIATEDPGYPAARRVLERLGAEAVPIPLGDGGMDLAALAAAPGPFAAALLTPSHQYPLGGRLHVADRLALIAWAEREDAVLIEDDYDSEFRHGAPALPAVASLDATGRVVHIGSYSKTLTPWLRCGYVVVPDPGLRARMLEVREDLGQPVSGAMQLALAEYLRSGGLRRHLARRGREYAHRRGLVMRALEALAPGVRLAAVEGGLHAVLTWDSGPPSGEVVRALARRSIRVAPLTDYYHPGSPRLRHGIVFGYGAPTDLQLQAALAAIVDELGGCAGGAKGRWGAIQPRGTTPTRTSRCSAARTSAASSSERG
ncbi:PLP-dependent aminotransferase family protein [Leucobacter luti]|uniref:MocR-like pyridoxine biosynthesis transcription factor PdxR n=1 Tax=Leucobacter luti TaxID=340320 RepID=UPI003CFD4A0A